MDRTCLVVGCGYVGRRLAGRLRPAWHVHAVVRSEASASQLEADGVAHSVVDLDAAGSVPTALCGMAEGAAIAWLAPPPETGLQNTKHSGS